MSDRDTDGGLDYRLPAMQISFGHGQFYLFGDPSWRRLADPPELRALNDAHERKVGAADGLVVVLCPVDFHVDASLLLEVWTSEPPIEQDDYDQVVDVDLDVPHGTIYVQSTDVPELAQAAWLRAAGLYRARVEGRGYTAQQDTRRVMGEHDAYRIQLWPRTEDRSATRQREWPGWNHFINPAPTDGIPAHSTGLSELRCNWRWWVS